MQHVLLVQGDLHVLIGRVGGIELEVVQNVVHIFGVVFVLVVVS